MHIDDLAIELAKSFDNSKLPPKLRYRLKRWLRNMMSPQQVSAQQRQQVKRAVKKEIITQVLDSIYPAELKKNEMMTSAYSDGTIKLDFGAEVPETIRKAAINWAKKRGLKAIEAPLNKTQDSIDSIIFMSSKEPSSDKICVKRLKWSF